MLCLLRVQTIFFKIQTELIGGIMTKTTLGNLLLLNYSQNKFLNKGNTFSEKELLQWNKLVGIMAHSHKAFLVPWVRKQLLSHTWLALKSLTLSFLSQGFALGDPPDAVCSCQWRNPRSLWHGCQGNYRFVSDEFCISSLKLSLSCLLRWFLLSSQGGGQAVKCAGISSVE